MAGDSYYPDYVTLLLLFEGTNGSTTIVDSSLYPYTDSTHYASVLTVSGNAAISTTQYKYGGSSLYLDGTGDYIHFSTHARFAPGTGDFTVELWVYPTRTGQTEDYIEMRTSDSGIPILMGKSNAEKLRSYDGSTVRATGTSLSQNTWQHVAWSRNGTTNRLFLDGVEQYNFSNGFDLSAPIFRIGSNIDGVNEQVQGYIDSVRFTKGLGRYTANFTPGELYAYAGQLSGNLTESVAVSKWRVTATKCADGTYAGSTSTTGSSYTVNCNTTEPCSLTLSPHVDRKWTTGYTPALGEFWVPSNLDATPRLYECTTSGAVGGSEPTWPTSGTVNDGSAVWTFVCNLDDGLFKTLGTKIPS